MKTVRNINQLRKAIDELAKSMQCGDSEELMLSDPNLIGSVPSIAMEKNLSLVDAREEGRNIVIKLVNRFGKNCSNRGSGYARRH